MLAAKYDDEFYVHQIHHGLHLLAKFIVSKRPMNEGAR